MTSINDSDVRKIISMFIRENIIIWELEKNF